MSTSHSGHRHHPVRQRLGVFAIGMLVCAALLGWPDAVHAQQADSQCNFSFAGEGAGPFDYRTQRAELTVVERRHFTAKVETLRSGESASKPGPDIGYTLRKYPNHHRALLAMSKLGQRMKTDNVPGMGYSIICYFERAILFRPDDTVARLIYAQYLGLTARGPAATTQLAIAATYAKDNALSHYNIGLVALELKDYERALKHAQIAYGLGITSPQLRDDLKKAGKWVDSAPPQEDQASAPARAASTAPTDLRN